MVGIKATLPLSVMPLPVSSRVGLGRPTLGGSEEVSRNGKEWNPPSSTMAGSVPRDREGRCCESHEKWKL